MKRTRESFNTVLLYLRLLHLTLILIGSVVIYRFTTIDSLTVSVGFYIIPSWFVLIDIIAEIYGFKTSCKVIWQTTIFSCVFSLIIVLLLQTPTPSGWHHEKAFVYVLGGLLKIGIGVVAAMLLGPIINTYFLTKFRILTRGRYFFIRSIASSFIGQIVFTIITIGLDMSGVLNWSQRFHMMLRAYPMKMIALAILTIPASIFVIFMKKIFVNEINTSLQLNPFKDKA